MDSVKNLVTKQSAAFPARNWKHMSENMKGTENDNMTSDEVINCVMDCFIFNTGHNNSSEDN